MIDKLDYVVALARERHFGRAAEACGVTQPTLSAGLKQLEEQLGVLIVLRSSRFLGFTPEGERVLAWARRMTSDAKALRHEVRALRHGLSGHLRLAAVPSALPVVARLTTPFGERHPAVRFSVVSRTSDDILRRIGEFEIDAGITYLDGAGGSDFRTMPLYYERYCFVAAADKMPHGSQPVTWEQASHAALCLLTPNMRNRRIIDAAMAAAGAPSVPRLESDSMIVLLSHVRTGHWASILPAALVEGANLPVGVAAVPLVGPEVTSLIGLVVSSSDPATTLVQALVAETPSIFHADRPQP